jgi:hypothetical protein
LCARQIQEIVGFQIEIERIFSSIGILTSLKRCCLQSKKLDNLIFVNKNWPDDPRIDCKSTFSLVDYIETNLNLEKELEFEEAFEKNKVVKL